MINVQNGLIRLNIIVYVCSYKIIVSTRGLTKSRKLLNYTPSLSNSSFMRDQCIFFRGRFQA
jgi:hypothetical protein